MFCILIGCKDDSRIRTIPFATRRPTFKEVQRVQQELAKVETLGRFALLIDTKLLEDFLIILERPTEVNGAITRLIDCKEVLFQK